MTLIKKNICLITCCYLKWRRAKNITSKVSWKHIKTEENHIQLHKNSLKVTAKNWEKEMQSL